MFDFNAVQLEDGLEKYVSENKDIKDYVLFMNPSLANRVEDTPFTVFDPDFEDLVEYEQGRVVTKY